jgi:hypothetical protein
MKNQEIVMSDIEINTYSLLCLFVDEDDALLINRWNDSNGFCVNQAAVTECAGVHQVVGLLQRTICDVENIRIKIIIKISFRMIGTCV